jgi:hypothetical protein
MGSWTNVHGSAVTIGLWTDGSARIQSHSQQPANGKDSGFDCQLYLARIYSYLEHDIDREHSGQSPRYLVRGVDRLQRQLHLLHENLPVKTNFVLFARETNNFIYESISKAAPQGRTSPISGNTSSHNKSNNMYAMLFTTNLF